MAKGYPDWHRGSLMQGLLAGVPTGVNMDAAGNLIALLKGLYGTTPTGLQCDATGNIKIDLSVQSATVLRTKPYYGVLHYYAFLGKWPTTGPYTVLQASGNINLISFNYSTFVTSHGIDPQYNYFRFTIDGVVGNLTSLKVIKESSILFITPNSWFSTYYDTVNSIFSAHFEGVIECSSSLLIELFPAYSDDPTWNLNAVYGIA